MEKKGEKDRWEDGREDSGEKSIVRYPSGRKVGEMKGRENRRRRNRRTMEEDGVWKGRWRTEKRWMNGDG